MVIKKILTLTLIYQHPLILLGMKKRGFGAGKWNGFGGKVQEGESISEAARREIAEETALTVTDLEHRGILEFEFHGDPTILEVHVFCASRFEGEPEESEEMRPQWFNVDEIPFQTMWVDDSYWLPLFLKGKKFFGRFAFGPDGRITHHHLEVL